MTTPDLFDYAESHPQRPPEATFNGAGYETLADHKRLTGQIARVYECISIGHWFTLAEIAAATGDPEASVSAQLRHLRKPRFGGYRVDRRRRGGEGSGLWEYKLVTGG